MGLKRHHISEGEVLAGEVAKDAVGPDEIKADAVKQSELAYEEVTVTVAAGATSGTATVTEGAIVLGYYPAGNQDQFVDNISISATTLTLTLAAAATADNVFKVVLLKP